MKVVLSKLFEDAMKTTVAQTVKETEKKHIDTDVLKAYDPTEYERRSKGGIDDPDNLVSNVIATGAYMGAYGVTLIVKNTTMASPMYRVRHTTTIAYSKNCGELLAPLIEKGRKGDVWLGKNPKWQAARPFITNTKAEIHKKHLIISSLKKYFEDMGATVK